VPPLGSRNARERVDCSMGGRKNSTPTDLGGLRARFQKPSIGEKKKERKRHLRRQVGG